MNDDILIQALRHMAPEMGSLHCLGCGHEHGCSLHGCAVINRAVERLEQLTAPEPNDPLTLEELREMDGELVYIVGNFEDDDFDCSGWKVVERIYDDGFIKFTDRKWLSLNHHCFGVEWRAYRRKPEEG